MGIISTAAKVAVASSVHGRVQRRQQQRWAQQDYEANRSASLADAGVAHSPSATPGSGQVATRIEQLRELGELRDSGVLTEEEFQAQKVLVLGD